MRPLTQNQGPRRISHAGMSNFYSAVAPPNPGGAIDPQSAFADALARARQVRKFISIGLIFGAKGGLCASPPKVGHGRRHCWENGDWRRTWRQRVSPERWVYLYLPRVSFAPKRVNIRPEHPVVLFGSFCEV